MPAISLVQRSSSGSIRARPFCFSEPSGFRHYRQVKCSSVRVQGHSSGAERGSASISAGRALRAVVQEMEIPASLASSAYAPVSVPETESREKPVIFDVTAIVTVRRKCKEDFLGTLQNHFDSVADFFGQNILLQLVSQDTDPKTSTPKKSKETPLQGWIQKWNVKAEKVHYTASFIVSSDFGLPGAIMITNHHRKEFYLETIVLEGFLSGPIYFPCNSWVQPKKENPEKRIFFSSKPYLPSETPVGLLELREKELKNKRGDGTGTRKLSDRIYDYDVYNDLGNPEKSHELARPVLGGKLPYPRRCRTGRPESAADSTAESRVEEPDPLYVPCDEAFEEQRQEMLDTKRLSSLVHNLVPTLVAHLTDPTKEFNGFSEIDKLYRESLKLNMGLSEDFWKNMPKLINDLRETSEEMLRYDTPHIVTKDKFAWLRDDEFARQTLAGVNPASIELLKVFPPKSNLDPVIYGPSESAITEDHISGQLNGMTVQQALEQKKLFILDYHDIYMPFLNGINAQDGRKAYATRAIFFLTPLNTLKPIAIELSLPPPVSASRAKRVFTPQSDATTQWLWQLAKAHVCANDAGIHQLKNHWLHTHACIEPFIISAHRNLSAMHPIFRLLLPHMRYTLEINAMARQSLISAAGVIESSFTPGKYCMEISAAAYKGWRFDRESLPADLVRRGVAEKDPSKPLGIKLVIEDYPYAADGILVFSAIQDWVEEYVNLYYSDPSTVQKDAELQAWWEEIKVQGHPEKKNEPWWPQLQTKEDLAGILTTMIWVVSGQHAALNFGQYPYGGYVPNRPCLMRRLIPDERDAEYQAFLANPQKFFLSALPSLVQSINLMAVIDTLSTHSADEEYLGQRPQSVWTDDLRAIDAFRDFSLNIQDIEKFIHDRNKNPNLRNRTGAGVLPYELLVPSSGPGVTCRGIPNSVSI